MKSENEMEKPLLLGHCLLLFTNIVLVAHDGLWELYAVTWYDSDGILESESEK